uniref:Uncharacterized protein n=1 Tax=Anopheles coluzzii TaxID=1518534 RepID=A0A8W7P184_ANOCL
MLRTKLNRVPVPVGERESHQHRVDDCQWSSKSLHDRYEVVVPSDRSESAPGNHSERGGRQSIVKAPGAKIASFVQSRRPWLWPGGPNTLRFTDRIIFSVFIIIIIIFVVIITITIVIIFINVISFPVGSFAFVPTGSPHQQVRRRTAWYAPIASR